MFPIDLKASFATSLYGRSFYINYGQGFKGRVASHSRLAVASPQAHDTKEEVPSTIIGRIRRIVKEKDPVKSIIIEGKPGDLQKNCSFYKKFSNSSFPSRRTCYNDIRI